MAGSRCGSTNRFGLKKRKLVVQVAGLIGEGKGRRIRHELGPDDAHLLEQVAVSLRIN